MTAGPQRLPRSLVADGGVDPVPGGGRVHQAERVRCPPLFERGPHHLNLEPGQVLPDLEQVVARRQAGQRDEIVVQRHGILRPDPVVPRGGRVERLPQSLAIGIRAHPGNSATDGPGPIRAVIIGNVVLL
jgi:hypothetical protein